jgi:hypothetical protein
VEDARAQVGALVNCEGKDIIWTSGATESINLALKGAAEFYKTKGKQPHHGEDRAQGDARHLPRAGTARLRGDYLEVHRTACSISTRWNPRSAPTRSWFR